MKWKLRNEKGMTLVELLIAIVLLGIVLVSFMSFFTQSAKFTAHNNEKLTAVQVAEDVIAEVRQGNLNIPSSKYENYIVTIKVINGPLYTNLKKAIITVKSDSTRDLKNKDFVTEMYFEQLAGEGL